MFTQLTLRKKLVAIVLPPLGVLTVVAAYAVLLGFRGSSSAQELTSDIRTLGVVALAAVILSALFVLVIGRTITDPLGALSDAADELANVRLPMLVESLRNPGSNPPAFAPISVENENDEMGRLIRALNAVQDSAIEVAGEQKAIVQAGVSDLVVNLARRNQSLIDRQIETIDSLESNEENPERLEELFALDHLATRMRRNAESLLVVAGAEPPRRRGAPVSVADVLRVAMSEIEDYRRVTLVSVDDALIGNQSAVDLAHLLSELMENAASFSPPDTAVEVKGMQEPDGYYLISVTDTGIGMSDDQLVAANTILSNPPELGLGLSRSLGFIVVGRLARRLGVRVELARGASSGVTALVLVPTSVLAGSPAATTPTPTPTAPPAPEPVSEPALVPSGLTAPAFAAAFEAAAAEGPGFEPPVFEAPTFDPESHIPPALRARSSFAAPPATQAPTAEAPFFEAPVFEEPAFEPSAYAPPVFDEPVFDGPGFDEPGFEVPFEIPAAWTEAPVIEPVAPIEFQSEALAELLGQGPGNRMFEPPAFEPPAFEPAGLAPNEPFRTSSLAQAIPDGDQFDAGIASLLQPGHPSSYRAPGQLPGATTGSGLARRDRSQSQAPPSEGRPVAPSVRSPEEIRQMLARYRDGRNRSTAEEHRASSDFPNDPFNTGDQA